jgi:hypothetical protein
MSVILDNSSVTTAQENQRMTVYGKDNPRRDGKACTCHDCKRTVDGENVWCERCGTKLVSSLRVAENESHQIQKRIVAYGDDRQSFDTGVLKEIAGLETECKRFRDGISDVLKYVASQMLRPLQEFELSEMAEAIEQKLTSILVVKTTTHS